MPLAEGHLGDHTKKPGAPMLATSFCRQGENEYTRRPGAPVPQLPRTRDSDSVASKAGCPCLLSLETWESTSPSNDILEPIPVPNSETWKPEARTPNRAFFWISFAGWPGAIGNHLLTKSGCPGCLASGHPGDYALRPATSRHSSLSTCDCGAFCSRSRSSYQYGEPLPWFTHKSQTTSDPHELRSGKYSDIVLSRSRKPPLPLGEDPGQDPHP